MTKIIKSDLTKEMIEKAMQCKTADKLLELAEAEGYEMTRDEAEAYIAELADFELEEEVLERAAGGSCYTNMTCDGNECNPAHPHCFTGDSEVAVPGGMKLIKDLQVGDKVITLDAEGNEIVGTVTEVMTPQAEEIFEVAFSDGTVWRTTESQTLYFGHEKNCAVKEALGKAVLKRGGATATVTSVKPTGTFEPVYDVLIGEEEDEDVIFVAGVAAEGYFTKGERSEGLQGKTVA